MTEQRQQPPASAQGVSAGSRQRPTGEVDSLADILGGMYDDYGVAPPLADAPAGAVDRFWRALAEMFDLEDDDRRGVMEATDSEALERLLTGAGGKAEWLDATPAASPKEVPSASPSPAAPVSLDSGQVAAEIEAFLIDFVVEQTGYPEEIIELDVDLEADLGIDSIRKAQMMGEVGQKYGLEADPELSLDDFPTLRHLLDYIVPRVAGGEGSGEGSEEAVTSEVDLDATVSSSPVTSTPTPEVATEPAPTAEARATNGAAATNGNGAVMPAAPVSLDSGQVAAEIEAFLIDFVVEQTGYPEEIIELDVDLEADLGIDSIRKAQMIEVGQKYGLEADTSMSLDDFPTLRHLLDYIVPRVAGGEGSGEGSEEAVTSEVDLDATVSSSPVTSTPTPEVATEPAPTAEARATNGAAATNGNGAVMPAAPVSLDSGQVAAEIEAFLIDFVVEQTGYPEEIIELDVDLEADLGIDSIRKGQMMGEVGQKYGLEADTSMSLDDFPTLRHLLDYIVPRVAGLDGGEGGQEAMAGDAPHNSETDPQQNGDYHSNGHASVVAEPVTSAAYQAGLEMGRAGSAAIHQWSRSVAQSPANQSVECALDGELQDQLEGIAKGAEVEVSLLTAAVSDPTRVVGNCDLLLDLPSHESSVAGRVRGFAMSFTRHVQMDHIAFNKNNLSGCLVTATGMPGAVVGWNDAGIVAILGPCATDESPISPGMPAGQVIQQIAQRCRSFDDVQQTIDRGDLERPPAGMSVLVADLCERRHPRDYPAR